MTHALTPLSTKPGQGQYSFSTGVRLIILCDPPHGQTLQVVQWPSWSSLDSTSSSCRASANKPLKQPSARRRCLVVALQVKLMSKMNFLSTTWAGGESFGSPLGGLDLGMAFGAEKRD